jgi:phage terminase large subunit-like protein
VVRLPALLVEMTDRATAYARDVLDGRYVVGELVRLACERHLRWIEEAAEPGSPFRWEPERSEKAIDFFLLCKHFEGPKAGEPIVLEPWQCFSIGPVYGWRALDDEGVWGRRIRRVFKEVAKKNGKSLEAGGIGILETFFSGQPGAQTYAAATKREQAKLVWGASRKMVVGSPALSARIRIRALSLFRDNDTYRPLGKETKTEDGINPSCVIIDEEHRHEDRSLIDLLVNSFGARRDPLLYIITTAGQVGESVWAEDHDYAEKVLRGVFDDDRIWPIVYNLDPGDDPFDEAVWPKANPNLGVSVRWDDMRERAKDAREKPGALQDFLRLRLNVQTQNQLKWLTPGRWDAMQAEPDPPESRPAYGGMDLGATLDLSALVTLATADDGFHIDARATLWCPAEGIEERSRRDKVPYDRWVRDGWIIATPGAVTDYDMIRAEIGRIAEEDLDLYEIGYDQHNATQLAGQLESDGFVMVKVQQSTTELSAAVTELERWMQQGILRMGPNPVMEWMAYNVVMVADAAGRRKPDKLRARERIDGISALLMAVKRYMANAGREVEWTAE